MGESVKNKSPRETLFTQVFARKESRDNHKYKKATTPSKKRNNFKTAGAYLKLAAHSN